MAQAQLNGLLQFLLVSLSLQDQEWLVRGIQENIKSHDREILPLTEEDISRRLYESELQIQAGEVVPHNQLMQHLHKGISNN